MSPRTTELRNARLVGREGLFDVRVEAGVISALSPSQDAAPSSGVEVLDLEGQQWVGPGLRDAHVHFSTWSLTLGRLDLSTARSAKDVAVAVLERSKGAFESPAQPLVGRDFRVVSTSQLLRRQ